VQRIRAEEVERLKSSCRDARNIIAEMFVSTIARPNGAGSLVAWGQYLDLRRRNLSQQYGIYGTSSGLQVLAMHDPTVYRTIIEAAAGTLPLVAANVSDVARPIHQYFLDKGDLNVVYKVAALADAVRPDLDDVPDPHDVVRALLDLRTQGGGWGYFRRPELDEFQSPNVHATSTALLALGRFSIFRASPDRTEALTWLARNVNTSSLSISTLSMILLALELLSDVESEPPDIAGLRRNCRSVVTNWARRSAAEDTKRTIEATEYLIPKPRADTPLDNYEHEFVFMVYLPHCLAALALMKVGNIRDRHVRRYIVSVVRIVADHICSARSFVAAGRNLESSVEHLWIYRLLREFERFQPYEKITDVVWDWVREAFTRRQVLVTLTIIFALYGILTKFAPLAVALLVVPVIVTFMINIVSMRFYEDMFR
jgi:hypothetical protein